ncbi:MAG: hypothetical protein JO342_17630 [Solirubrobacterales bacterium]|nr:hypothetical protein [Solirubrobacterales bacterium]
MQETWIRFATVNLAPWWSWACRCRVYVRRAANRLENRPPCSGDHRTYESCTQTRYEVENPLLYVVLTLIPAGAW